MNAMLDTEGLSPDLALCAKVLMYAAIGSEASANRTPKEIQDALLVVFTKEQIRQALAFIRETTRIIKKPA
jgi:hypothetical protein